MQAVQATAFGDPSVLEVVTLPDPTPAAGQISIDVTHSAVGLIDLFFRQGRYKDVAGMPQTPFVPGLEVAGTVRALGEGVTGFTSGEQVVTMSAGGTGGYATVSVAPAASVVSIEGSGIDPALAVAAIPNAAMAHVALVHVAHLHEGESVLIHGALGGFAAAFAGIAKQLGVSRVVGTVRGSKLAAAATTKLPYDAIVDSADMLAALGEERFDVVIDPVGGDLRTQSLDLMQVGGRLIASGNASEDWGHRLDSNQLWLRSIAVLGFNSGAFLPTHPQFVRPALEAALEAVAAGLAETVVDVLPLSEAAVAHSRMEERAVDGRIVLATGV